MSPDRVFEGFFIVVSIALLLGVGLAIALRSGVRELNTGKDYLQAAGTLSKILLRIAGYVAVLLAVQHLIGLRPSFGW
jgi:hypothetical protein